MNVVLRYMRRSGLEQNFLSTIRIMSIHVVFEYVLTFPASDDSRLTLSSSSESEYVGWSAAVEDAIAHALDRPAPKPEDLQLSNMLPDYGTYTLCSNDGFYLNTSP